MTGDVIIIPSYLINSWEKITFQDGCPQLRKPAVQCHPLTYLDVERWPLPPSPK
jgi:hypothetical protein